MRAAEKQPKLNTKITVELSKKDYDTLVNKFTQSLGCSIEEATIFLLLQAMAAPESAFQWMINEGRAQFRAWENNPHPKAANAFEAHGDEVREQVLQQHKPAIKLAADLDQFITALNDSKAELKTPDYEKAI